MISVQKKGEKQGINMNAKKVGFMPGFVVLQYEDERQLLINLETVETVELTGEHCLSYNPPPSSIVPPFAQGPLT